MENFIEDEIYIFVTFDSISKKKGLKYHDLLMSWDFLFEKAQIQVCIATKDSQENLDKTKEEFHSNFKYISLKDRIPENLMEEKFVFGNQYEIISSRILIVKNQKIEKEYKRINKKTLENAYFKALNIKIKIFLKNIKKMIDSMQKLW